MPAIDTDQANDDDSGKNEIGDHLNGLDNGGKYAPNQCNDFIYANFDFVLVYLLVMINTLLNSLYDNDAGNVADNLGNHYQTLTRLLTYLDGAPVTMTWIVVYGSYVHQHFHHCSLCIVVFS